MIVVALAALARGPCPETVAEGQAFYSLMALPPIWPPSNASSPVFRGGDTYAEAYTAARGRITGLADKMASTADCALESLGCFAHIYGAHETLRGIEAISVNGSAPTTLPFWDKTRRTALVNLLVVLDACEARVQDLLVNGNVALGLVEYTPPK